VWISRDEAKVKYNFEATLVEVIEQRKFDGKNEIEEEFKLRRFAPRSAEFAE
jgi:hypothetical protein